MDTKAARRRITSRANEAWKRKLLATLERENIPPPREDLIDRSLQDNGGPYAALMRLLAHVEFEEDEAERHWRAILGHRRDLEQRIGRDPGLAVSVLDYLQNVQRLVDAPRVVGTDAYNAIERRSMTDKLTGLFNRNFFHNCLDREIKRVTRFGGSISLALLDLDDFRRVNRNHGRSVGNEALVHMSAIMRQTLRRVDLPCRHGGEAFAVIMPATQRVGAYVLAERIRTEVEQRFRKHLFGDRILSLTISGGIASFPKDAGTPDELILRADRALDYSKRQGKNRILVHVKE